MQGVSYFWRWGLTCLWMGLIFFMSSQTASGEHSSWLLQSILSVLGVSYPPDGCLDILHMILRKFAHVFAYALLALLFAWSLAPRPGHVRQAWLFSVAYATSDELHQLLVPHRGGQLTDVGIDAVGVSLALLVWVWRAGQWGRRYSQ